MAYDSILFVSNEWISSQVLFHEASDNISASKEIFAHLKSWVMSWENLIEHFDVVSLLRSLMIWLRVDLLELTDDLLLLGNIGQGVNLPELWDSVNE